MVCGLLTASAMLAVPAKRGWQTKTQADGTMVELQLVGDEFYHYWETRDGKIAIEQKDGRFVVTNEAKPTSMQMRARRAASPMHTKKAKKAIGERNFAPKGLVLLVQFSDVTFQAENDFDAFNDMLNKAGYNYNGAVGSAKDYFKAQSNNAYSPQFDVFGPITLPHNEIYYGEQGEIGGSLENDMYLADFVIDACKAADDAGCDFSQYDSDNDGYVDIVYLFYAGKGQADGGETSTIWPHNWELESALYYELTHGGTGYYVHTNSQGYIIDENLPVHDGKTINNYVCSGELQGDGSRSGIGTLCHEFSHVLGLPDYYDTSEDEDNDGYTPNDWSLMDYGSYLNDGNTPPNYSIYDKYFMGWATPKFLAKNAQKTVTMTTGYDDAYQITGGSELVDYTNTGTIYYLENRQLSGWDEYLPGSGMLVWKVKYNKDAWEENGPNATAGVLRCTPVCAAGGNYIGDIVKNKTWYHHGENDPFPGASNVQSYTPATGCALTEITETASNITFKYNGGATVPPFDVDWYVNGVKVATTNCTGDAVLPSLIPESCSDGRKFVGWCKIANYSNATTAPTFVKAGSPVEEGDKCYAVFASGTETSVPAYEKATSIALNDSVVLVYETDSMELTSFTTSGTLYGVGSEYTERPSGQYAFKIVAGSTNGTYAFQRGGTYLYYNSGNTLSTNASLGKNTSWTIEFSSGNAVITNAKSTDRVIYWNSANPRFACYNKSGQKAIQLYKRTMVQTSSYSDYSTSCTATNIEDIEETKAAVKALRNGQIVIIRGEAVYTVTGNRIQ